MIGARGDLQPAGGLALGRARRTSSAYPHDARLLPFAPGQAEKWDASLVGTGVIFCSDALGPPGAEWVLGEITKAQGGQRFELRLATKASRSLRLPYVRAVPTTQGE